MTFRMPIHYFSPFILSEHAGFSKGGAPLIGASIIACYATASRNVEGRKGQGLYGMGSSSGSLAIIGAGS
jgi:hypothetical protein